jgi:hypothetical protein
MATQQVSSKILAPIPMPPVLGSPYCYDPTCPSCKALRDEYAKLSR